MVRRIKKSRSQDAISLTFNLNDLPTAQHKSGLAGLVMLIQLLPGGSNGPEIEVLTPSTARLRLTEDSLQTLFDDLFDARPAEIAVRQKWHGKPPKSERSVVEKDGTASKRYVYEVVQPKGRILCDVLAVDSPFRVKLWRDMIWTVLRSQDRSRRPFQQRARGEHCSEAAKVWSDLKAFEASKAGDELHTCGVTGTTFLGGQEANAEAIKFRDRSDHALLLRFWQITTLIFLPAVVRQDGVREIVKNAYVIAVPEVADLCEFVRLFSRMLRDPAGAKDLVVDLPEQGALEFLCSFRRLAGEKVSLKDITYSLASVEFFQMAKTGKKTIATASGSIPLSTELLDGYQGVKLQYRNALFRSATLLAILREQRWHEPFGNLLAKRPWPFFVKCEKTPKPMRSFRGDVAAKFKNLFTDYQLQKETTEMRVPREATPGKIGEAAPLEIIVYRVVQSFVRKKTEAKSGLRYKDFKTVIDEKTQKPRKAIPTEYIETRQKLCSDTFLAFRSRRDREFVDYFTSTIGSVAQRLCPSDYSVLADALMRTEGPKNRDDVKILAMLALSASS